MVKAVRIVTENTAVEKANSAVSVAMTYALGFWFVPVPVVGSMLCDVAEKSMIREILSSFGVEVSDQLVDGYFWFYRKQYFLVNVVTYIPYAGATIQLLEVYGLGQFVITCCCNEIGFEDEVGLAGAWDEIEPKLWDANGIVAFYESVTCTPFPAEIRPQFVSVVNGLGEVARAVNRVPALVRAQRVGGDAAHKLNRFVKSLLRRGPS